MYFDELSNDEWALLRPMISDGTVNRLTRRGRPRAEPRVVANAILWVMTTGEPWSRLPCKYPSGPTCRCRFEEWRANGTLSEMVELLSKNGRTFAYVPTSAPSGAGYASPQSSRFLRDDGVPQVLWKSANAWQTSSGTMDTVPETTPLTEIARQLTERDNPPPVKVASEGAFGERRLPQPDRSARAPWMGLLSRGRQVEDARGYVLHAAADPVAKTSFRAWAEIMKGGRRVARSGLTGPRFEDLEAAQQYALDWARKWIDQHCPALPVKARVQVSVPVSISVPAAEPAAASSVLKALPHAHPVAQAPVNCTLDELCHEHIRW
jgi:transposase